MSRRRRIVVSPLILVANPPFGLSVCRDRGGARHVCRNRRLEEGLGPRVAHRSHRLHLARRPGVQPDALGASDVGTHATVNPVAAVTKKYSQRGGCPVRKLSPVITGTPRTNMLSLLVLPAAALLTSPRAASPSLAPKSCFTVAPRHPAVRADESSVFTAEELAALEAASVSLGPCGEKINGLSQKPETLFANIRAPDGIPDPESGRMPNMIDRDPDEETWTAVRAAFPVLAPRSDAELNAAVRPIRMVKVSLADAKQRAEDEEGKK